MPLVSDYSTVAVLTLAVMALVTAIALITHIIGPKRLGERKLSTYESGMEPIGDARKRFNVRFYLVAVLFIVFDVELVILYPWGVLFPQMHDALAAGGDVESNWAAAMSAAGYTPGYVFGAVAVFFTLLLVGFVYEWKKGIFKWD